MKQLSGNDNFFLLGEHGNVYKHIAMLMIYDVSTARGGAVRFKDVVRHFESRLAAHPIFRRRLVNAPLGLDRPFWVEDKAIDLDFHVRHIALPKPGDWRQLMIQTARLHSRPLDRSRPLWEAYVIEGLDNIPKLPVGSFAVLLKLHHSAVDDLAGVLLTEKLHATAADARPPAPEPRMITLEKAPAAFELLGKTLAGTAGRVRQFAAFGQRTAALAVAVSKEHLDKLSGMREETLTLPHPPHTRFNNAVSGNRVSEGFGMPHSRINLVRAKIPCASANDVVLATVGGALRRYLAQRKELRQESLVAFVPMEMANPTTESTNEQSANAEPVTASRPSLVPVRSDIADPIERLHALSQSSGKTPLDTEAMGSALFAQLLNVAPAFVGNFLINKLITRNYNFTLASVDGPDKPLYLAGAKAMCLYSFGMPADGAGLVISAVSYNRVTWVSMVACRDLLPDPGVFEQCLRESWEELRAAAEALPEPVVGKPSVVRKERSARPAKAAVDKSHSAPRGRHATRTLQKNPPDPKPVL